MLPNLINPKNTPGEARGSQRDDHSLRNVIGVAAFKRYPIFAYEYQRALPLRPHAWVELDFRNTRTRAHTRARACPCTRSCTRMIIIAHVGYVCHLKQESTNQSIDLKIKSRMLRLGELQGGHLQRHLVCTAFIWDML